MYAFDGAPKAHQLQVHLVGKTHTRAHWLHRMLLEEDILTTELPGYREYLDKACVCACGCTHVGCGNVQDLSWSRLTSALYIGTIEGRAAYLVRRVHTRDPREKQE